MDRLTGRQRVGSTGLSTDFVLSQSPTGQGPFNEFLWSGQPAETIFTLMLGLMAKPFQTCSGRGRERGSCPHAEGTGANSTGKGGWSKRSSREKEEPLPLPKSPAQGADLPLCLLHLLGFSLPAAPAPLAAGVAGAAFPGSGVSPGCPPRWESPRSQHSPWRGFVGNQTQ